MRLKTRFLQVRRLIVPPPVLLFLLKNPLVKNYDLSCIKEMRSGAAPLGKEMEQELTSRYVGFFIDNI